MSAAISTRSDSPVDLDVDLSAEALATPAGPSWQRRMMRYLELSTLLRVFGAGVTVAAISVFVFQHWESGNDLFRYSLLLGQTVVFCLIGFGTNRWLKEPKSARVLLALGLASTAACTTAAPPCSRW